MNFFHNLAAFPLDNFDSLLLSKPIQIPVVRLSIEPINQRSLFPSDVPVLPNTFSPFIEAAMDVPSVTDFSRSLLRFLFTFKSNIFLK